MKQKIISIVILLSVIADSTAQLPAEKIFTLDSFIMAVKKYHPVVKQADILVAKANADLLSARGGFDPAFQFAAGNKTFDGKNYYYYSNPELTIPLPVGNVKAGLENSGGDFLNSEITRGKTSYAGVEIPLLKGLLTDKRRAALHQAKIYTQQSEQERLLIRNNLLFDAYMAYWSWAGAYRQYIAYSEFASVAEKRLRLVRIAFNNGDRALMDTTEAFIQLQNYQLMQAEALLNWRNAGVELSNYLWQQDENTYSVKEHYLPEKFELLSEKYHQDAEELVKQSSLQNPSLKMYDFKLGILEVERKLKQQSLLPYVSLKANMLNKDYYIFKNINTGFLENNYKVGIDVKIPLFFREARGDYKKAKLKIEETKLDLLNKKQQTENKIRTYLNEYNVIATQLKTVQSMYDNYKSLLRNEELKFAQGESSLFLVNSREMKLIESLQKKIDLTLKFHKAKYAIEWASGMLN